jgi:hypothetical protein
MLRTRFALLLAVALAPAGCRYMSGMAIYAGTAMAVDYAHQQYENGEWINDYTTNLETTWRGTLDALGELNYQVKGEPRLEGDKGVIEVGNGKITVEKHPYHPEYSRVRIRWRVFEKEEDTRRSK